MDKIVTVGGKEVGFRATALTPRIYRHKIGRDLICDMNQLREKYNKAIKARGLKPPAENAAEWQKRDYQEALQEAQLSVLDLEIFENVAFIMARQFDPEHVPESSDAWLDEFEIFSIYEILPQILQLWQLNQETTSVPKKK